MITSAFKINFDSPCVLALGCFDGVHLGHQSVLAEAKKKADEKGLPLRVFTFEEPPKNFFASEKVPLIITTEEKLRILKSLGVDSTVCLPLSAETFSIEAEDFVRQIAIRELGASCIVCGFNYRFGKNANGDVALLKNLCKKYGAELIVVSEYKSNGIPISSSMIRETIKRGDMEGAEKFLGRYFSIRSKVVTGQHLARKLGFPTVNLIPDQNVLLPKRGVYVTKIVFNKETWYGITNIGVRPTVNTNLVCAETHIFNFDGDLYDKEIEVGFIKFIREERKFPNVDSMADQVENDIILAKDFLSKNGMCHF